MTDYLHYNDRANSTSFTLTATNSATSFPVTNVLTDRQFNTWRSTGTGTVYVTFNGSASRTITGVILFNINLVTGDTLQLQTSDDDFATTKSTTDFTVLTRSLVRYNNTTKETGSFNKYDAYVVASLTAQDFRIKMASTSGVTYYEIGRVYISSSVQTFLNNPYYKYQGGYETVSRYRETEYGNVIDYPLYTRMNFPAIEMRNATNTQARVLCQIAPMNKSVCYFIDALGGTGQIYLCKLRTSSQEIHNKFYSSDQNNFTFSIVEHI